MSIIRPDLTNSLIILHPNDWVEIIEIENGIEQKHDGQFNLFTNEFIQVYIYDESCKCKGLYNIYLQNIVSIIRNDIPRCQLEFIIR